jgi:hypothetical protein
MEIGRWLKPGLRPDFSDPIIAAIGAAVAFKAMPHLWRIFEREAAMTGTLDSYIERLHPGAGAQGPGTSAAGVSGPSAPEIDGAEPSAPPA